MKKITAALIAIAIVAVGAMFVLAQTAQTGESGTDKKWGKRGGMHRGMRGGMHGGGMMLRGLDLTDEQKAQVKAIRETNKQSIAPLFEAMKANRQKLNEATANGNFDEGAVTAIAAEHGSIAAQMLVARERVKAQTFAILTDEQKTKLAAMKQNRKERFGGFRHRGGKKAADSETVN